MALYSSHLFVKGTYDLDQDGMSEILLFSENNLRYVEMDLRGQHHLLWELAPEDFTIQEAFINDLNKDGKSELVILADYFPGVHSGEWVKMFSWNQSDFLPEGIHLDGGWVHPTGGDMNPEADLLAVSVGSPVRKVVLLNFSDETPLIPFNIILPPSLHNGLGNLFVSFMKIQGQSHLAVYSPEEEKLKVVLYRLNTPPVIVASGSFPLAGSTLLLGASVAKTDLDGDLSEELQLPFADGKAYTLSFVDSILTLRMSNFNGQMIFSVQDTTSTESINKLLLSRVESGLVSQSIADEIETDSIETVADDTLLLGDTLYYQATSDTGSGFYSFRWLNQPPDGALFNPASGYITWIPHLDQIGVHNIKFIAEERVKNKLISENDHYGDSHRLIPVLKTTEQNFSIMVVDTTKPLVIYVPPPFEPYMVSVQTPGKTAGSERFIFDGTPPFQVMVDEQKIPNHSYLSHTIFANIGKITNDKYVEFSYSSYKDSVENPTALTIVHDLFDNEIDINLESTGETVDQLLTPADWRTDLANYPIYHFTGFSTSFRLGEAERGISIFDPEDENKLKKFSSFSIITPPEKGRHRLTIISSEVELWNMKGIVSVDSSGHKQITTIIIFSGNFQPYTINSEMQSEENISE